MLHQGHGRLAPGPIDKEPYNHGGGMALAVRSRAICRAQCLQGSTLMMMNTGERRGESGVVRGKTRPCLVATLEGRVVEGDHIGIMSNNA